MQAAHDMSKSLESRVVVVTGATAGVGRATVRAFARHGAKLALIARDAGRLRQTAREVRALGGEAETFSVDVADAEAIEEAADAIERRLGPIDIWINNAMTSVFGEFVDIEPDEYRRVTDVVYHGTVYGTMVALRRMVPRDEGSIVLVGSALAYRGIPLQAAYCGAKHAVLGMFESLRSELMHRKSGVHVTMVQLPALNTPQFAWVRNKTERRTQPVPPIFQPEVAADAIVHAATHNRREMWVTASTYKAILGNKFAPRLADRVLARRGYQEQYVNGYDGPRPSNLWEPVPGPFGAHGAFDDRAKWRSPVLWLSKHRMGVGLVVAGALASWWARRFV
jgi:short-subunit dehydrogenase